MSLARALQAVERNPLALYRPTPGQQRFHDSTARVRLLRAPNQVGKSFCGAAEALFWMLGKHPYQDVPPAPSHGRLVPYSIDASKEIESKLWELLPKGALHPGCKYDPDRGFRVGTRRILRLRNGSTMTIVSQEAGTMAAAGATLSWVWFDEPPPASVFAEGMARTTSTGGRVWLTLTPIGRPVDWLKAEVERGSIEDIHYSLSREACPWLTQEQIDDIIAHTLQSEAAQRIHAAWSGSSTGRFFAAWEDSMITDDLPQGEVEIGLGIDHGEDAGRELALLVAVERDGNKGRPRLWFLDEYASAGKTGIDADATGILDMIERAGLQPEAVDIAVGDHNSAGKGLGYKVNQLLTESIARQCGRPEHSPPFTVKPAHKGPGSVVYTSRLLHGCQVLDNFRVSSRCPALIDGLRHWHGPHGSAANKELSHALDAARYIGRSFLDTRSRGLQSLRVR